MNYSFGDNRVINFFSKKENYKKYNTFKIWCKHYEPFLEDLFYEFVCICENNEIQIFTDDQTKQEFYFMLYNTSNGFLVDKTKSIWPCILAHIVSSCFTFFLNEKGLSYGIGGNSYPNWLLLISLSTIILYALYLFLGQRKATVK